MNEAGSKRMLATLLLGILLPSVLLCAWGAIGLRQDFRLRLAADLERREDLTADLANRLAGDLEVREALAVSRLAADPGARAPMAPDAGAFEFVLDEGGAVIAPAELRPPAFDPPAERESELFGLVTTGERSAAAIEDALERIEHPNLRARLLLELASEHARSGDAAAERAALERVRSIQDPGPAADGFAVRWIVLWRLADTLSPEEILAELAASADEGSPVGLAAMARRLEERFGEEASAALGLRRFVEERVATRARYQRAIDAAVRRASRLVAGEDFARVILEGSGDRSILGVRRVEAGGIEGFVIPLLAAGDDVRPGGFALPANSEGRFAVRAQDGTAVHGAAPTENPPWIEAALPGAYGFLAVACAPDLFGPPPAGTRWMAIAGLLAFLIAMVGLGAALTYRAFRRESEVSRMKTEFVARVSHELRTPLASIRLFGEMLRDGRVRQESKRAEYHDVIVRESERLTRLIERVLSFSRIERDELRLDCRPESIEAIVLETVRGFEGPREGASASGTASGAAVDVDVPADLPPALLDRDAVSQILWNLLDNARKYSPDGSPIRVRLAVDAGAVRVTVEDEGPGIPPAEQARIFEKFRRGRSDLTQGVGGVGLGLTIARHLAVAQGGGLEVESDTAGSRFTLVLPAASDLSPAASVSSPSAQGVKG